MSCLRHVERRMGDNSDEAIAVKLENDSSRVELKRQTKVQTKVAVEDKSRCHGHVASPEVTDSDASRRVHSSPHANTMPGVKNRKFVPLRQPMISSYFAQPSSDTGHHRSSSPPIDLTLSDSEERPSKRQRTTSHVREQLFLPPSPSPEPQAGPSRLPLPTSTPSVGTAERWRYASSASQEVEPQRTAEEELSRSIRRTKLAKKLMMENNPFLKMPSPLEIGDEGVMGAEAESQSDSGNESDGKFKELQEMFSHSGKGKSKLKRRTATPKAKKAEEIGPSGQSYTPLEHQVGYCPLTQCCDSLGCRFGRCRCSIRTCYL